MESKIKKFFFNKEMLIYIVVTIMFFGIFIAQEFALDSYATYTFNIKELYNQFAPCGRFLIIITGTFLKLMNISDKTSYFLSYALAMVCMILSQYKLFNLIKKDVKNRNLQILIPILLVLNIFSIELFLFIEKGIMILSVFLCICALDSVIKFLEKRDKKHIIFALIYVLLANFSYQGVVGIFVALSLIYILKYSKTLKDFIVNNILVALIYGIPSLLDYILIKLLSVGSRVSGNIVIAESIKKIIQSTLNMMVTTYEILPKFFYLVLVLSIIIIISINIYKVKDKKLLEVLKIIYIFSEIIIATIFPQIMQNTDSIWFVPRSTYSYASILT